MIRTDSLKSEIERLAQVLARIMRLKLDGELDSAGVLFNETIESAFSLSPATLENPDVSIFEKWLNDAELAAEKLDSLSELLYYELGQSTARNHLIAPKLDLIYQILAKKHKIVHLVNFHRQEIIQQYL